MPYSEHQLKKHLDLMEEKQREENPNIGVQKLRLVAIVETQEEADMLNIEKMNKGGSRGSNQTHNLDSGYGSEDKPNYKTI